MSTNKLKYILLEFDTMRRERVSLAYDEILSESRMIKKLVKGLRDCDREKETVIMVVKSSRITKSAIEKLTDLDMTTGARKCKETVPTSFSDLNEFCACIMAIGYLGMDNAMEQFRSMFLKALSTRSPSEASRELFDTDTDVLDEKSVNEIFADAWKDSSAQEKDASDSSSGGIYEADDEAFNQSIYGRPSKIFVYSPKEKSYVPKVILEKRDQAKIMDSAKCSVSGCKANNKGFWPLNFLKPIQKCRSCGLAFCSTHLSHSTKIPYMPIPQDGEDKDKPLYVCDECYEFIEASSPQTIVRLIFGSIFYLGLPLRVAARAAWLSENWNEACLSYWNIVRNMQIKSPAAEITDFERNFLWYNRDEFSGHSYWLMLLLRVIDWSDPYEVSEAERIIAAERKVSCESLFCKRTCTKSGLKAMDAIALLCGSFYKGFSGKVREYIVDVVRKSPTCEFEEQILQLVYFTTYEPCATVPLQYANEAALKASPLTYMLLERLESSMEEKDGKRMTDRKYALVFYWSICACTHVMKVRKRFEVLKQLFAITLSNADPEFNSMLFNEELFIGEIQRAMSSSSESGVDSAEESKRICESLNKFLRNNVVFVPYNPFKIIKRVVGVKRFSSNARPLKLECEYEDKSPILQLQISPQSTLLQHSRNKIFNSSSKKEKSNCVVELPKLSFMYKPEDLIKDSFITKFLYFVRRILMCDSKDPEDLEAYNVVPMEPEAGFIEMLSGKTWDGIEEMKSLPDYILTNTSSVDTKNTYLSSIIVWIVLSYVLGFGDRHKENMMITDSGRYVNIDFGFIFGKDPHSFLESYSRIPNCGIDESDKKVIADNCKEIFILVRRYAPHIISFFSPIKDFSNSELDFSYVEKQLALSNVDEEANELMSAYVNKALGKGEQTGRDMIHNLGKYWVNLKKMFF